MLNFSCGYSKIKLSSGKIGPFVVLFVYGLRIPGTAEISAVLFLLRRLLLDRRDIGEKVRRYNGYIQISRKSVMHIDAKSVIEI